MISECRGGCAVKESDHWQRWLLRAYREGPRRTSCREEDELPSPHSRIPNELAGEDFSFRVQRARRLLYCSDYRGRESAEGLGRVKTQACCGAVEWRSQTQMFFPSRARLTSLRPVTQRSQVRIPAGIATEFQ